MRETKDLEFKEQVSKTFLKTVSAFANYGTGEIKFGIKDNGQVVGVDDPERVCLDIENKINDSIQPNPKYDLDIDKDTRVITLRVYQGTNPPYFYKSKAYKRNDSASIEVDPVELSRLILKGKNQTFDSLQAQDQNLTFSSLETALKDKLGIKALNQDILITLDLLRKGSGYTNAGALLADHNHFRGINLVRFGANLNIMLDRKDCEGISVLDQYNLSVDMYRQYYQHEEIKGINRELVEEIPEEAFREAVANALVHRTWDVNSQIKISMFDDGIEIASPGGLPSGLSKEEYLLGQISILRNPILANVFYRLGLIEQFGTGIRRIISSYQGSVIQPKFKIFENSIVIILPLLQSVPVNLSEDEGKIYQAVQSGNETTSKINEVVGFGRTKTLRLINSLVKKGYLVKLGEGRSTKYMLPK